MKLSQFVPTRNTLLPLASVLAVTALSSYIATATPYATCVTNSSGTIYFRLNESASNVKIIHTSNSVLTTNDLGALGKGLQSVSLAVTGPFRIQVTKSAGAGYLKGIPNAISEDSNPLVNFAGLRGVAVNINPASPFFGRTYVACGAAGTAGGRATGDGIYVLNADQTDAVGQGNTALTGGIDWSLSAEGPHRINVGEDDNLYICDWSDAHGGLFVADPDVSATSGKNVLTGNGGPFPVTSSRIHGSTMGVVATGSLANNNLTVWHIDEDLQLDRDTATKSTLNTIWRWDIGGATLPYSGWPPVQGFYTLGYAAQLCDLKRGPDGKFYYGDLRADPASTSGAFVLDTDATTLLWSSLSATRAYLGNSSAYDLLNGTRGIGVSPDGQVHGHHKFHQQLDRHPAPGNGIPNMTNIVKMGVTPTSGFGRGITFDAAGNIYSISSGQGLLRIYSPGGLTIATTGSDGTFSVTNLVPIVTLAATQASTSEDTSTAPGTFTISRYGRPH